VVDIHTNTPTVKKLQIFYIITLWVKTMTMVDRDNNVYNRSEQNVIFL